MKYSRLKIKAFESGQARRHFHMHIPTLLPGHSLRQRSDLG
jgi:hypothetical protein